jgi:hypothetical protein
MKSKGMFAALLLLLAGVIAGVAIDRMIIIPHQRAPHDLTVEALADQLDLDPAVEARVRLLVDSMTIMVAEAARHGPDSLRLAARRAHERIEAALPPDARTRFRAWVEDHHEELMHRMDGFRSMHSRPH